MIASASGPGSAPACAHVPDKVAGEISAPSRARPVTGELVLRPAANRPVSSIAMNPWETRPLPAAFGGPGAITVAGTRQAQARRQRRRQCATSRPITSRSGCSPDQCSPGGVNGSPHCGQRYPPSGKSQNTSNRGRRG